MYTTRTRCAACSDIPNGLNHFVDFCSDVRAGSAAPGELPPRVLQAERFERDYCPHQQQGEGRTRAA
jgi:hypothetical protein